MSDYKFQVLLSAARDSSHNYQTHVYIYHALNDRDKNDSSSSVSSRSYESESHACMNGESREVRAGTARETRSLKEHGSM